MQSTSTAIRAAEDRARAAFKTFDVLTASHRAQIDPPDPSIHRTAGQMLLAASKFDAGQIKGRHAELEGQFTKDIAQAFEVLDAQEKEGMDFLKLASFLRGESNECPPQFAEHAKLVKLGSVNNVVDAHRVAADIERAVQSAIAELSRVKNIWVAKTKDAAIVASRGKRFMLSRQAKFDDVRLQEHKLAAVQKMFDSRHGVSNKRRTNVGSTKP